MDLRTVINYVGQAAALCFCRLSCRSVTLAAAVTLLMPSAYAAKPTGPYATYTVIHQFGSIPGDGLQPAAGLVSDAQGQLYGTTQGGGQYRSGTIFRLTPPPAAQGGWTYTILHSFSLTEGVTPLAPVTLGSDGTIYGTTSQGGTYSTGTVFSLAQTPNAPLVVLHSFGQIGVHSGGGGHPMSALVFGRDGMLYGTTSAFALLNYGETGTDFRISPLGDKVAFETLNTFGQIGNGYDPEGLTATPKHFMNGFLGVTNATTTSVGPGAGPGIVYGLMPRADGSTGEGTLYTFNGAPDVANPLSPLLFGVGALAGTALGCTSSSTLSQGRGGVYQLSANGSGGVSETVINFFANDPDNTPVAMHSCGLAQASLAGELLLTTDYGGFVNGGGIYQLTPPATPGGQWTEQQNVAFGDGKSFYPQGALIRINQNFYGTTYGNPTLSDYGVVYELQRRPTE